MTRKAAARSEQLLHLKSYGRMALTNYLGRTFLLLLASGYIFHLFTHMTTSRL
ncbi:DUF418 domain-containing protein [Brevibacillus laterosporus]|uniref:DUF418 domain-containing protein n=1 Tax=Brevibacillus laterosporus TaxID=1465 RepID=A0A518VEE3_BRELA|nr:DUF418 domain-containing protein [Brevibacillus laterosporus]